MSSWPRLLLLLVAGCGRVGFGAGDAGSSDAADVAPPDARGDADAAADASEDADAAPDAAEDARRDGEPSTGVVLPADGYFQMERVTTFGGSLRSASAGEMVGDMWITGAGVDRWTASIRYASLSEGVPDEPPVLIGAEVLRESDGRYLLSPDDGTATAVFAVTASGGNLEWNVDGDDPRSGDWPYASRVVVDEAAAPPTETAGSWLLESFMEDGLTVAARTCEPYFGAFTVVDMGWEIDGDSETSGFQRARTFSDSGCTTETMSSSYEILGFILEDRDGGARAFVWDSVDGSGIYARYDYALMSDGRLRLSVRECSPTCASLDVMTFAPL